MAENPVLKMFYLIFSFLLILNNSFSYATTKKNEKCDCYDLCEKNFTNSITDFQKITACQRGCRFYSLVLFTTHESDPVLDSARAKEGCLLSCSEGYLQPFEVNACKFGCSAVESSKLCNPVENETPQISYSFVIEESDVLIHPGEPDPDDSLTDPGLRKQFQKTLVAFLDSTPKIPEIRFRNLPIRTEKISELSHSNYKCPKFYGLDSKFEFRNGKIIIGDLYLFLGVFVFVVLCFVLGHHIEAKHMKKQLRETRLPKKKALDDQEQLLKVDCVQSEIIVEEAPPEYILLKPDGFEQPDCHSPQVDAEFETITLVFHDDDSSKENQSEEDNIII